MKTIKHRLRTAFLRRKPLRLANNAVRERDESTTDTVSPRKTKDSMEDKSEQEPSAKAQPPVVGTCSIMSTRLRHRGHVEEEDASALKLGPGECII